MLFIKPTLEDLQQIAQTHPQYQKNCHLADLGDERDH